MRDAYSELHEVPIVVSYSIGATNNALGIFINDKSGNIVGGAYLNHALDMPTGDSASTKLKYVIGSFNDNNSGKKKADEIKIATVVYQKFPDVHSPIL